MTPETQEQIFNRAVIQKDCKHEFETIEMPYDWERMSTAMCCEKCSYSIPIYIERVKEMSDE